MERAYHVGQPVLDSRVIAGDWSIVPILGNGCCEEGDTGFHGIGSILGGTIDTVAAGSGKQIGRFFELLDDEVPGILLRASRNEQAADILAAVVVVIERFGDDRNAAIGADHAEIDIAADEVGLAEHGIAQIGADGTLVECRLNLREKLVDRTDVGITPVAGTADTVGSAMGIGCIQRILVERAERIVRDIAVCGSQQADETCLAGGEVVFAHLREIAFKTVEKGVAGDLAGVLPDLPVNNHDKVFLEKIYGLIEEHLSEEDFNVSTLAAMMGMSRSGLFSKVKALTGQSPQEFLINYRLSRARELLKSHEYNISEVAYKVGFSTLNGLSRAFKNKYGVPPSSV